jgi:hypothetical protein
MSADAQYRASWKPKPNQAFVRAGMTIWFCRLKPFWQGENKSHSQFERRKSQKGAKSAMRQFRPIVGPPSILSNAFLHKTPNHEIRRSIVSARLVLDLTSF